MRSTPRKPAWPSLVWNTSGRARRSAGCSAQRPDAADAEQHLLQQPVLAAAAVQAVGDVALGGSLSSTSESSSSSGTRPTCAFQTWATSVRRRAGRRDLERAAVRLAQQRDRQPVGSRTG
jgi:hypothetical protein